MPAVKQTAQLPLAGKWSVVTGSSSGIGRAMALEFAAAGANVIVHGNRRREKAEQVAKDIKELGRSASTLLCDFANAKNLDSFVEQCWQVAPIDIWVNNAGLDVLTGEASEWSFSKKFESLWPVDVAATMQLSRAVGERMQSQGSGTIINIGWDQAATGMEGDSGEMFATTKGAVMAFTRSLAKSLAPKVRVNCIAPGWIKTDWGNEASEYWQQRAIGESLLERWGTPEDIAKAAKFLASDDASFITGQILNVNGGQK